MLELAKIFHYPIRSADIPWVEVFFGGKTLDIFVHDSEHST